MFEVGDRIVITDAYPDLDMRGDPGTIVEIRVDPHDRYPITAHIDNRSGTYQFAAEELEKVQPRFEIGDHVKVTEQRAILFGKTGTIVRVQKAANVRDRFLYSIRFENHGIVELFERRLAKDIKLTVRRKP